MRKDPRFERISGRRPADDLAVIARVRPLVDKLIAVIMSGRPVMLTGITGRADAVVEAWLPGTEGEGLADVLLGAKPFTGTTPYAWPASPSDAPRVGKTVRSVPGRCLPVWVRPRREGQAARPGRLLAIGQARRDRRREETGRLASR